MGDYADGLNWKSFQLKFCTRNYGMTALRRVDASQNIEMSGSLVSVGRPSGAA